ncbi:hypothetical protein G7Y89_g12760 [Cudoniella acicularis]|uniref:Peptidase S8/S53 domain-containing protein n=1 Tax=Cudoniella acicularis TaxID=354080 RepID=A0A8H4VWQ0_9HELO|nr:hypothetical protein G7Y89_g12760 [Cudoniella acicularis]
MALTQELLLLLAAVVPEFLKLATFFTGDSEAAFLARQGLEKEAFYAKLHVEFKSLEETLLAWDPDIDIPEPIERTLVHALDVLESRFVKIQYQQHRSQRTKYQRLQDLRRRVEQDGDNVIHVEELRELINLADRRKKHRTHMVNRLTMCSADLGALFRKARIRRPKLPEHAIRAGSVFEPVQGELPTLPSSQIRDHATLLHEILAQNWKCNGHIPHTETKLRLATHRTNTNEARFELAFCCAANASLTWQESEVRLVPKTSHKAVAITSMQARSKEVTFSLPPKGSPRPAVKGEDRWPVEGICKLMTNVSTRTSCRLKLLVEEDELWYLNPASATEDIQRKQPVSLKDFLNLDSPIPFDRAKKRDRFILQVILANAFLHFYNGPWLLRSWNKTDICFYQAKAHGTPDITRPYLSTKCQPLEKLCDGEDRSLQVHPYPGILALGILLLEIELGRPIENERSSDNPNNADVFHIDADRPVAMEMLEECTDDSSIDFVNAVKACLDDQTFTDEFGRNASFDDLNFRQRIFELIVKPLEESLQKVFGQLVEKLDVLTPAASRLPEATISRERRIFQSHTKITPRAQSLLPMKKHFVKPAELTDPSIGMEGCLCDDLDRGGVIGDHWHVTTSNPVELLANIMCSSSRAEQWLMQLHERVHPLIEKTCDESHSSIHQIFPRPGRVRIAILDTGIDLPDHASWIHEDQIRDQKSWLSHGDEFDQNLARGDQDLDGHGTHGAALLAKVAPDAEIYVARVFKDRNESKVSIMAEVIHQRIADVNIPVLECWRASLNTLQAIKYAVEEWGVDIISMSFGFERSVDIIDKAIRFADDRKVIMLAAASNQGGNSTIAWPARLPQVICIHATDSFGNRCDFTPTESPGGDNFATLGQAVKSCWPPHLGQGDETRKSGTSTATPIAAGIAALVLQYVKIALPSLGHEHVNREVGTFSKLRSSAGMSTVFRRMANRKRGGYDYLVPWDFLNPKYQESTVCDIILDDLRDI